ncbi:hypothetical protein D3C72_1092100 [compost metagenome]
MVPSERVLRKSSNSVCVKTLFFGTRKNPLMALKSTTHPPNPTLRSLPVQFF